MITFITNADSSSSTISVSTAELRTGFTNVDIVNSPALFLCVAFLLNPSELSGAESNNND